jgi:hypothetical protein
MTLESRSSPGIDPAVEIHRAVDAAAKDRFAGENERQEDEKKGDSQRDAGDEAADEPDRESRRGRVGQSERGSVEVQRSASNEILFRARDTLSS